METSSGNDYTPEESGCGGSGNGSESLDTESKFFDECTATADTKASNRGRSKTRSVMPKVEVLWQSFEEGNLMDSSGSDFKAGVDSGVKLVLLYRW